MIYNYNVYSEDRTPMDNACLFYGQNMKENRENG
jgi:hypothetical protein